MVEFALGAIALFTILFAIMTFGYTFGKQLDLQAANRSAARRAAVTWENVNATTAARQVLYDEMTLTKDADVVFTITPSPPWTHGQTINVRARTHHDLNVLGVTAWSGDLKAATRIRVE
jgi:hypothetical protein